MAVVLSVEDVRASSASALLASTLQCAAGHRLQFGSAASRVPIALARGYRRAGGSDVLGREARSAGPAVGGRPARSFGSGGRTRRVSPAR